MSEFEAAPEAPVAEQTPVAETQPAAAAPPPAEGQGQTPEPPAEDNKGKERLQARFSELTGKVRSAEQEAAYWREQAMARAQPEQPNYDPAPEAPAINPDDIVAKARDAIRQEMEAASQRTKIEAVRAKVGDGQEGAIIFFSDPALPVSREMLDVVLASDNGVALADHLGKNPQEAARISALPASGQGYELARLESRLASQRTTNAPGPTPTVNAAAPVSDDFRPGMSQAEFEASIERKHGSIYGRRA